MYASVLFDHRPHLTELRRGKRLRCTSCHSQIVQGSHITVTSSTCILCHFKGVAPGETTSRCTLCHEVPQKVVSRGGMEFDHADVSRFDMRCSWCHAHAARGDGGVPRERCLTCHNDPARLGALGEVDRLHRAHVSEHKVDCLHCHLEIEHGTLPVLEAAAGECASCHSGGHSPQRELYAGIGGLGVEPRPGPMFLAGVRCEGCHFLAGPGRGGAGVRRASEVSCMSCHGPAYRRIFLGWRRALEERTKAVRAALADLPRAESGSAALLEVRANLELVESADGVHNVEYALALLERAFDLANQERAARGLPRRAPSWAQPGGGGPCLTCHAGIESQEGVLAGRRFSHRPHLVAAALGCPACHRPHEERSREEVVRFGADGCTTCHHRDLAAEPAVADCAPCHGDVAARTVTSHQGDFAHSLHLELVAGACVTCHVLEAGRPPKIRPEACADCHA